MAMSVMHFIRLIDSERDILKEVCKKSPVLADVADEVNLAEDVCHM